MGCASSKSNDNGVIKPKALSNKSVTFAEKNVEISPCTTYDDIIKLEPNCSSNLSKIPEMKVVLSVEPEFEPPMVKQIGTENCESIVSTTEMENSHASLTIINNPKDQCSVNADVVSDVSICLTPISCTNETSTPDVVTMTSPDCAPSALPAPETTFTSNVVETHCDAVNITELDITLETTHATIEQDESKSIESEAAHTEEAEVISSITVQSVEVPRSSSPFMAGTKCSDVDINRSNTSSPLPLEGEQGGGSTSPKMFSSVPERKKGYILKQGHFRKNWKNRYFVLDNGELFYYESSTSQFPYGVKQLGDFCLNDAEVCEYKSIVTLNSGDGKTKLIMEIKYPNEREEWILALREHVEYLRLIS